MTFVKNASKDDNDVSTLIGVSSLDGKTPVAVAVDPVTGRVLVDLSGGGLQVEVPPEAPDGSRTTFTFANTPMVIVVDQGRSMRSTVGWTYAGTTATLDIAPIFDIFSEY